ncbi:MAG: biosynthetic arginine decarboxylase [Acidobacteriota bacterium]|nr:biosynthetic arginine decarboxylase [Blastocatellia bacterium]MDW8239517.1 biosynthetic arginine decarboxylase [Acidobacteriota bacterium]
MTKATSLEQALQTYGVENWGAGYFGINKQGNLIVRPTLNDSATADIKEIVDKLIRDYKLKFPILLRFPQIVASQVRALHNSFKSASQEFGYKGAHMAVYPMKVNSRREVIEAFLQEGRRYDFGLEAGSKAELYAALSLEQTPDSLLICNGFKDEAFINLAILGSSLGKRVIVVIEKLNELMTFLRLSENVTPRPMLGARLKLYSRGSGRWEKSGGETAKFGLTATEMLEVIRRLREVNRLDELKLLHCHLGSQMTDIKRVKNAVKEAARVYAKVRKLDVDIEYLDLGGGMAVDYDGSKTSYEASANYTMQEFANDVIYTVASICEDENVPEPTLISESGRILTAHHAMIVMNVQDEIETVIDEIALPDVDEDDPQVVIELRDLRNNINAKNYLEYYHDALEHKDELFTLFNLGYIDLEDRAKGEVLFWQLLEKVEKFARETKFFPEELEDLKKLLAAKYLCNFSVFRSVPDAWGLDYLFPIMPIHRLLESASEFATLVDLTCDSDGIIDKFVDLRDVKEVLEVHPFNRDPYYLAILLVGAYQEAMGSFHNLFGIVNEANIVIDQQGTFHVHKVIPGHHIGSVLELVRFDKPSLQDGFRRNLALATKRFQLSEQARAQMINFYEQCYHNYTYLE